MVTKILHLAFEQFYIFPENFKTAPTMNNWALTCDLISKVMLSEIRVWQRIDTCHQSMKWIELKRSSPVQIHESLILIQSNPADDPEAESSPVQSGHYRVDIYQIPCKIYM